MLESAFEQLVVFTRYPEPGVTKTRLIPLLGPIGAAKLQRRLTEQIVTEARQAQNRGPLKLEVRFEGGGRKRMKRWLGADLIYRAQGPGDLGQRMEKSFNNAFQAGANRVVLIGSDIPQLSSGIIQEAFERLQHNDLVLGPARDGGYYLIGMRKDVIEKSIPVLFEDIAWGTATVLKDTLQSANRLGIPFSLLETLSDIDRPEDFHRYALNPLKEKDDHISGDISIVIPTLNESEHIGATLAGIWGSHIREVIIADGGSVDDTVHQADRFGAQIISARPPRARQMNQGAAAARGQILLFLHADTYLPMGFDQHIQAAVRQSGFAAGAFSLRIDSHRPTMRIVEIMANWRSRCLKMPYGDQALFMSRKMFKRIGGFRELPIMEDFEMIRRIKKIGDIVTLPEPVLTASRRWDNFGLIKTTIVNQLVVAAFMAGISPQKIARFYQRGKGVGR